MAAQEGGEVHFDADLGADLWTGLVTAAENCVGDGEAVAEDVLSPGEELQLVFAEAAGVGNCAVNFGSQRDARIEVVGTYYLARGSSLKMVYLPEPGSIATLNPLRKCASLAVTWIGSEVKFSNMDAIFL